MAVFGSCGSSKFLKWTPKTSYPNSQDCKYDEISRPDDVILHGKRDSADVIKATNELTLSSSRGRLSTWAYSNPRSPLKGEFSLASGRRGNQGDSRHDVPLLALKTEGTTC